MGLSDNRKAIISLGLDPKGVDYGIEEARRRLRSFEDSVRAMERRKKKGGRGNAVLGGIVGGITASITGRATDMIGDVAGEVVDLERDLTRLQIAAGGKMDMEAFRKSLSGVSKETGIARSKLVEGASAYVALTGDSAGAAQAVGLFGKVAQASGAEMADIATTAAAMKDNLGVDPKDFQKGFDILITQGKLGAVELKNLAQEMSSVAPSFAQFKGAKGVAGVQQMGAAMQVVRKGFGSASEAGTGLRALIASLNRHSGKLGAQGIKVFTGKVKGGKKEMRGFIDIVDQFRKKGFSSDVLTTLLGSDEAKRAMDQLLAQRKELGQWSANEGGDATNKDAAEYAASAAGRIDMAWNSIREKIAEALTPARVEAFARAMEGVVQLAGALADRIFKVIDAVPGMQREFRRLFGIQTDDDTIVDMQRATLEERQAKAGKMGVSGAQMTAEDKLADAFREGKRASVRLSAEQDMSKAGLAYTLPELQALQRTFAKTDTTDQRIQVALVQGIVKTMIEEIKRTPQVIQFGNEPANRSTANSRDHRKGK